MPYITQEDRVRIDRTIKRAAFITTESPGHLNYAITKLVHNHIDAVADVKGYNYRCLNEVIGVLECLKLELYRQIVAPYEDKKKKENGPVSNLDQGV